MDIANLYSIYRLQLKLASKPFTLKELIHSTVPPILTANRSKYSDHHLDLGFEKGRSGCEQRKLLIIQCKMGVTS